MLLCSYILLGAYAVIAQVVGIREILVVFYGNELCLGVVLACWLLGMAGGAGLAARVTDRLPQQFLYYVFLLTLLNLLFPVQIYGIRNLRGLLQVPPGELITPLKLVSGALSTITPLSFLIGAIFPVACSLSPHAQNIGRIYIAEALGSMFGGLLLTFWLVTRYNAFQIAALTGGLIFLAIAGLAVADRGKLKFALLVGIAALICCGVYGYAFFSATAETLHTLTVKQRWADMQPRLEFVASVDSQYANLALGLQAGQYALFTNGQYAAAFPDAYGAAETAHFYLTEHPAPRDVLLIGGGAEGLIGEMLQHPLETLDYIELDPQLLALLAAYLPPDAQRALHNPHVTVIYADGRYYVKQTARRYDMVVLNLPTPTNAMLNRFYTLEFFQEAQRILKPGGVVVTKISASLHLQEDAANYTGSLYKTLRTVFPYVLVAPGVTHTYFATAAPDVLTFDPAILSQRYVTRKITSAYFSEYHYETFLQPDQIAFAAAALQRNLAHFRLNTDFQPVTYFYSLLLWTQFAETTPAKQTRSLTGRMLHVFSRLPVGWFFAPLVLFVLFRIGYICKPTPAVAFANRTRFNCLWIIGVTGFAGMALEVILFFAFQSMYGYIYQKAGLIVAVFMVGLAAGGYLSQMLVRRWTDSPSLRRLQESFGRAYLLYIEVGVVIFAALLPASLRALSAPYFLQAPFLVEIIFMALVGVSGILTGAAFPLASAIYLSSGEMPGKAAGLLASADYAGAFCGALLIGTLFVPLFGITPACYFISGLNVSSVLFLSVEFRQTPAAKPKIDNFLP